MQQKTLAESGGKTGAGRRRFSITTILTFGFGGFIFVGMAIVLAIGLWSASSNTLSLLGDKVSLSIQTMVDHLRRQFDPVVDTGRYLAQLVASGRFDPADQDELGRYLTGAVAATPQVLGMGYLSARGELTRVTREGILLSGPVEEGAESYLEEARRKREPYWGELMWSPEAEQTLINLRTPVFRGDRFLGVFVSVVSVADLSKLLDRTTISDTVPYQFILYGRDHVLAHRSMVFGSYSRSSQYPIPRLDEILDPVLQYMWREDLTRPMALSLTGDTTGHRIEVDGQSYLFFYRALLGYGPAPLYVGVYLPPNSGQGQELERLMISAVIGVVVLIVAVAGAFVLGRRLSRPIETLADAALRIGALDIEHVPALRRSRLREIDDAAAAFNAMTVGLRWFETYVPRKLVKRLYAVRRGEEPVSEEQIVSVMFTDIVHFPTLAERLSATEAAALLNEHFTSLAECIDAEDGIVDKYIGDSIMAFWGPPLGGADHAVRACRAALAIRSAMIATNTRGRECGRPAISIRIGIHSGRAIIGNIGAPGRVNYTLVGDTVNIAQRVEQLGRELGRPDEEVTILVSGDVADALEALGAAGSFTLADVGNRKIRGREAGVEIFRLG